MSYNPYTKKDDSDSSQRQEITYFGLGLPQEPKYTTNAHGKIVNRKTRNPIPDDEPVFILRARDCHAAETLEAYQLAVGKDCSLEHFESVGERIIAFKAWALTHPVRLPTA